MNFISLQELAKVYNWPFQVWKEQSTENKAETSDKQDKQTKVGSKKGPSKRR